MVQVNYIDSGQLRPIVDLTPYDTGFNEFKGFMWCICFEINKLQVFITYMTKMNGMVYEIIYENFSLAKSR